MSAKSEAILEAIEALDKEIALKSANGQDVDGALLEQKAALVEALNETNKQSKKVLNG